MLLLLDHTRRGGLTMNSTAFKAFNQTPVLNNGGGTFTDSALLEFY
jgi:hypothetical protein